MDVKDILIVPHGVETPIIHTVSINSSVFNIAIELKLITLLGASTNSVNSEYRQFNLNARRMERLFAYNTDSNEINKLYKHITTGMKALMKRSDELKIGMNEIKNITHKGIQYSLIYYLLLKRYEQQEENFVQLNEFSIIPGILSVFDKVFQQKELKLASKDIKLIADYVVGFENMKRSIGSKIVCLTRNQVNNSTDLSQTVWKSLYINRIIYNMPYSLRQTYLSPMLDWGLIQCATKSVLTNTNLIARVVFGENIHFIRSTAYRQNSLANELILSQSDSSELDKIKNLTHKLKEATMNIDYTFSDVAVVMFYTNMGNTLYDELNYTLNTLRDEKSIKPLLMFSPLTNFQVFKQVVFQYLYTLFLLAKHGIIHNDLHLNNLLISKPQSKYPRRLEYTFPSRHVIDLGMAEFDTTIIDYDKSVLSHRHHNGFDRTADEINEEVSVVFDTVKETIVTDYDHIFNCFVMYDVIRLGLTLQRSLEDFEGDLKQQYNTKLDQHFKLLSDMVKMSSDTLRKIYDPNAKFPFDIKNSYGSMEWLICTLFKTNLKTNKPKSSSARDHIQVAKVTSTLSDDRPEFISSKRKYADLLKQNFIAKYATNDNRNRI